MRLCRLHKNDPEGKGMSRSKHQISIFNIFNSIQNSSWTAEASYYYSVLLKAHYIMISAKQCSSGRKGLTCAALSKSKRAQCRFAREGHFVALAWGGYTKSGRTQNLKCSDRQNFTAVM